MGQAGLLGQGLPTRDIDAGLGAGAALGWLDDAGKTALIGVYRFFATLQTVSRLLSETVLQADDMPASIGQGGLALLLREMEAVDLDTLCAMIDMHAQTATDAITRALTSAQGDA